MKRNTEPSTQLSLFVNDLHGEAANIRLAVPEECALGASKEETPEPIIDQIEAEPEYGERPEGIPECEWAQFLHLDGDSNLTTLSGMESKFQGWQDL
jgi:hypothetical protein